MEATSSHQIHASEGGTAPLIPDEWARDRLTTQWPELSIDEVLPRVHPLKWHARGHLPEVGQVGIRILAPDPHHPQGQDLLAAVYERAQALRELDVPGTARILDAGDLSGYLVLVSEWHVGRPLIDFRRSVQPEASWACHMIETLARPMEALHRGGFVHGYLRSDSVLVTEKESLVLCGHGFMDLLTGKVPGPLHCDRIYLAPELNKRETTERCPVGDVYSLGVVVYELLTGEKPTGHFMKLPSQVTGAGKWLDDVVLRTIHPDPELRIPSVDEFRHAMAARELRVMDLSAKAEEPKTKRRAKRRKRPVAASGVVAELRLPMTIFFCVALAVIGASLYFGSKWHRAQQESQMTMEEAMMAMGQLVALIGEEAEEPDIEALLERLDDADPETIQEALDKVATSLQDGGQYEEALALAGEMAALHEGEEGDAQDAIRAIHEALAAAPDEFEALMAQAEAALLEGDLEGELEALTKALEVFPQDASALRRLSQTPKHLAGSWAAVQQELRRWNPEQKTWHVTLHRHRDGLHLDLSGHPHLVFLNPIKHLPVDRLNIRHTGVRDLVPATGMELGGLAADHSSVRTLAELRGEPIRSLSLTHTPIHDFKVLKTFPDLSYLRVDPGSGIPAMIPVPVRGRPWENSEGMRFLPVLGCEGLLVGARELTRLEADPYLSPRGLEPSFEGDIPALLLPAELTLCEAVAYGEWLSLRERAAGCLLPGARYRLPTASEQKALRAHVHRVAPVEHDQILAQAGAARRDPSGSASSLRPVAEGPCLGGFFDVLGNAAEWDAEGAATGDDAFEDAARGLRLVLDLTGVQLPEVLAESLPEQGVIPGAHTDRRAGRTAGLDEGAKGGLANSPANP